MKQRLKHIKYRAQHGLCGTKGRPEATAFAQNPAALLQQQYSSQEIVGHSLGSVDQIFCFLALDRRLQDLFMLIGCMNPST